MANPTKGPWQAHGDAVFAGTDCIALCDTDNASRKRYEANARLIAAAPQLLSSLEAAVIAHGPFGDDTRPAWWDAANAAVSAARGSKK